jgi:ABC-type bacteriocin/lantibiotic exporter with double-glycine peptidase domain
MSSRERRIVALGGLLGITGLLCLLPMFLLCFERHREALQKIHAWMMGARFIADNGVVLQLHDNDCGPAALKMILADRGIERRLSDLASDLRLTPRGTSMLNLRLESTKLGVPAKSWMVQPKELPRVPLPAIAFIKKHHFVVIRKFIAPKVLEVDDPALGRLHWPLGAFQRVWSGETLVFDPAWSPL